MTDFEKWKIRYGKHWATKQQLHTLVELQVLTPEQYFDITGESYTVA